MNVKDLKKIIIIIRHGLNEMQKPGLDELMEQGGDTAVFPCLTNAVISHLTALSLAFK